MHDPQRKKYFLSMYDQLSKNQAEQHSQNGHPYAGLKTENEINENQQEGTAPEEGYDPSYSITDEIDHQILMHRDAHFGGDFDVMLSYYQNEDNIGVNPDFDIERIIYLFEIEKEMGQDVAPLILTGVEAEAVGRARASYAHLKEIYEFQNEKSIYPRLIADLILTEEQEPLQEIEAVVSQGTAIIPDLLSLINSDEFYDALFPGYGYAPYLAIICLGRIGDSRAVIPIFEVLSRQFVFDDIIVLDALAEIGDPAKDFLLKILKSRPLTQDNLHAAFALTVFAHEPEVAINAFLQLQDPHVQEKPLLSTYLLCCCEAIRETSYSEAFKQMAYDQNIPTEMRVEMQRMIEQWND